MLVNQLSGSSNNEYRCRVKSIFPSNIPRWVFKLDLVARGPFGKDGLFGDEAMPPLLCNLVELVHPAFSDLLLLIVMVGNSTGIDSAAGGRDVRKMEVISEQTRGHHGPVS